MLCPNVQYEMIKKIADKFPETFGLRAFPGKVFCISTSDSYVDHENQVVLYTAVKNGDNWGAFAKGSEAELRAQIVPNKL